MIDYPDRNKRQCKTVRKYGTHQAQKAAVMAEEQLSEVTRMGTDQKSARTAIEKLVKEAIDRPCRWTEDSNIIDVYNVEPDEYTAMTKTLHARRPELVKLAEGSVTFIFHSKAASKHLNQAATP